MLTISYHPEPLRFSKTNIKKFQSEKVGENHQTAQQKQTLDSIQNRNQVQIIESDQKSRVTPQTINNFKGFFPGWKVAFSHDNADRYNDVSKGTYPNS